MRLSSRYCIWLCSMVTVSALLSSFSYAQDAGAPPSSAAGALVATKYVPSQDSRAISILSRASAALGGASLFSANTAVIAEISQTSSRGETLASLKAEDSWANGQLEFRREASGGTGAMVSNHGRPMLKGSDGSLHPLAPHTGYGMAPFYLPGAVLYNEAIDGRHSIKLIESTTAQGTAVQHVRIWDGSDLFHAVQSTQDWYFDSDTGLPVRVEHRSADPSDGVKFLKLTTEYTSYSSINGIFTASQMAESTAHGGKITKSLTSLTLVPSAAGTDFETGGAQ